jgi:hypothetical protein
MTALPIEGDDLVDRAIRRISACTYTANVVRSEIIDPCDIGRRADLLIASYDLLNEARALVSEAQLIAFQEQPLPQEAGTETV